MITYYEVQVQYKNGTVETYQFENPDLIWDWWKRYISPDVYDMSLTKVVRNRIAFYPGQ